MKHYNITTQEQVDYTLSKQVPIIAGADLYRATGETEERHWSGPWDDMLALYKTLSYSNTRRLRATLQRVADGDFAELSATWTLYSTGDGQTGGTGGAEDEKKPGEDRDHPEYDLQTSTVQEPILTHPKWASLEDAILEALKMVMDGYKRTTPFEIEINGKKEKSTLYDVLKPLKPKELLQCIIKGVTHYNAPHSILTVRYRATEVPYISTTGSIVASVPGGFATPSGRDWYFHGPSWQMKGSELWVTEVYELSGPGGWNKFIYS